MRWVDDLLRLDVAFSSMCVHHLPAVRKLHIALRWHDPTDHPAVSEVRQRLREAHRKKPKRERLPAPYQFVRRAWLNFDGGDLILLRNAVSTTFAFHFCLRSKEYSLRKQSTSRDKYQSRRRDVVFLTSSNQIFYPDSIRSARYDSSGWRFRLQPSGTWLRAVNLVSKVHVTIHGGKTSGKVSWRRSASAVFGSRHCVVAALLAWIVRSSGDPDDLLFNVDKRSPLYYSQVLANVKLYARQEGLDPSLHGTHSLRAGCASALIAAGVSPAIVQKYGRWASIDSMDAYIVPSEELFAGVSEVLVDGTHLHFLSRL